VTEIETDRLLLRHWREGDLDSYARICADQEVMRYMGRGTMSREQTAESIERFVRHWKEHSYGLWAVEEKASGTFVGRIGLLYHEDWPEGEHKAEVAWLVDRAFWGRGFATEGALASLRYGFEELGLDRIISISLPENRASRRVMEKAGLTYQGETRWRGHDVVWYAVDRDAWQARSRPADKLKR
jgi:ribosomal-protein-alanine N-acetyltransferase